MVLSATGPISFSSLQTEMGGSAPISMSEYYYSDASKYTRNLDVPATGSLPLGTFRGKGNVNFANLKSGFLVVRVFGSYSNVASLNVATMDAEFGPATGWYVANVTIFDPNNMVTGYEYTGWMVPRTTGDYSFGVRSCGGSDLAIYRNGAWDVITSAYGNKGVEATAPNPGTRTLTANVAYPLRIRHHFAPGFNTYPYIAVTYKYPGSGTLWYDFLPTSTEAKCYVYNTPTPTLATIRYEGFPDPSSSTSWSPKSIPNLVGWYDWTTWFGQSRQWGDKSDNYALAYTASGTFTMSTLNGLPVLTGTTTSKIRWDYGPTLPATYTLFHVAKYNGANRDTIFCGNNQGWISGFSGGRSGVAYHGGILITDPIDRHGNAWVVSTDQNALYRSQGIDRTVAPSSGTGQLCINYSSSYSANTSDWAIAEILVYNRTLTLTEIANVEAYLFARWGLAPDVWTPRAMTGLVGWYDGASWTGTQWSDKSGYKNNVTTVSGTFGTSTLNGLPVLTGSTTTKLKWPAAILPATYTLFHVARQPNDSYRGRIFSSESLTNSWYSGFYNLKSGLAGHNDGGGLTNFVDRHGNAWVVSTDQNAMYRSQGYNRTVGAPGSPSYTNLTINYFEPGYWAVAEILVYNRTLTANEIANVEQYLFNRYGLASDPWTPAAIGGLVGWYDGASWTGTQWSDKSGYSSHATTVSGTFQTSTLNGLPVLTGTTLTSIKFPMSTGYNYDILPNIPYTLFHVAKYNGNTRQRIFTSGNANPNWYSGFYGGSSGVANHNGSITDLTNKHGNAWVVSADQNALYRSQGRNRGVGSPGTPSYVNLTINYLEPSDWAIAEILVYNRTLSANEIANVEQYLFDRYGLAADPWTPTDTANIVAWYDGGSWTGSQWSDKSGAGKHAANVSGTFTTSTLNGLPVLTGNTTTRVQFPTGIVPNVYTLFHVAKYNGPNRRYIFNDNAGTGSTWASGFVYPGNGLTGGKSGTAYHGGFFTDSTLDRHGNAWVVSADQPAMYRSQGFDRTVTAPGTFETGQMNINWSKYYTSYNYYEVTSDWAVAEIIVYNRTLSNAEIATVEQYLFARYNLLPDARQLPMTISGLVGWYDGASWDTYRWVDKSGTRNHVVSVSGAFTTSTLNGLPVLMCNSSSTIVKFPANILPATYTLFHVAKHFDENNTNRIFTGVNGGPEWFSFNGMAIHGGQWLTEYQPLHGNAWVVSTDQNALYRSQGVNRTSGSPGTPSNVTLAINDYVNYSNPTNFAVAEIIVYNRTLTASEVETVEGYLFTRYGLAAEPWTPTATSGLVGWYDGSSWTGTQWTDKSGAGNHATTVVGPFVTGTVNSLPALTGNVSTRIKFPMAILPPTYTLFHVAKFNGATRQRIFTNEFSTDPSWCSGFFTGNSGVAFHNGYIAASADRHGNAWVVSTDQNALYRSQGFDRTTGTPGTPSYTNLTINYLYPSDWAVAEIIVYDRTLTANEISVAEQYLFNRYMRNKLWQPTNTANLVAWYDGLSWQSGYVGWNDKSGKGNHVTIISGPVAFSTGYLNKQYVVRGNTSAKLMWPANVLPSTYTMFHVAKYNGANIISPILCSNQQPFISGFYNRKSGVAWRGNKYITEEIDRHGNAWVVSTDQNALYRSQGLDRTIRAPGTPSHGQLCINYSSYWNSSYNSDWAVAEIIVYDRTLTTAEIENAEQYLFVRYGLAPDVWTPMALSGLVGWYDGASWTGSQWTDKSGAGNHVANVSGTFATSTLNGLPVLTGDTTTKMKWPANVLPSTYTLFHVAKYDGGTRDRIFTSANTSPNWYSGFNYGKSGTASHGGLITAHIDMHGDAWVVSADQNAMYRSQGVDRTIAGNGSPSYTNLTINHQGPSDWAAAEILVYNRTLTTIEVANIEQYLVGRYNITPSLQPPSANLVAWYDGASWTGTQWTDKSGKGNHAANVSGTFVTSTLNGRPVLTGTTTSKINFPAASFPNVYTMFHVAKYNGATRRAIFTDITGVWFSGFLSGMSGIAYQCGAWITSSALDRHGNAWVVSADQPALYKSLGVDRTIAPPGTSSRGDLVINAISGQSSDWAVAEILVYNRLLSNVEIATAELYLFNRYNVVPDPEWGKPLTSGLVGWYDGSSWTGSSWSDKSGAGNHVANVSGTFGTSTALNGLPVITGTTTSKIKFPAAILPATYTLFHVAKYNGATRDMIFSGNAQGWYSGFSGARSGLAFHNANITDLVDRHGNAWVVSTDQNAMYRSQGLDRTTASNGIPSYGQLTINWSSYYAAIKSDWAVAEIIVYNRTLTAREIATMEQYLFDRYGLAANPWTLASMVGMVGWYDGASWTGSQWSDKSGYKNHVTAVSGTIQTSTLNGLPVLTGNTSSMMRFPTTILPATYTLFHVAKYNGAAKGRIFTSETGKPTVWYSGFYGGLSGVAGHNGGITTLEDKHGNAWVVSTDQNALYRSQGFDRTTGTPGTPSYANLTINYNNTGYSDWAVAEVLVFNRTLANAEISYVEQYLFDRYNIYVY